MTARFYWMQESEQLQFSTRQEHPEIKPGRGYSSGWLILSVLTATLGLWFLYSWLVQPAWPASLPAILTELIHLTEMAAVFTLAFLWVGLLWRSRGQAQPDAPTPQTLDQLYVLSPKAFEHYVAALFRQKGYRVVVRGKSGDHGVDLELSNGKGQRAIVQCKRYQNTVGEEIVRDLYGTLVHERVARAFLVTTAEISDAAHKWAQGKPITLIDGKTLVRIASALAQK